MEENRLYHIPGYTGLLPRSALAEGSAELAIKQKHGYTMKWRDHWADSSAPPRNYIRGAEHWKTAAAVLSRDNKDRADLMSFCHTTAADEARLRRPHHHWRDQGIIGYTGYTPVWHREARFLEKSPRIGEHLEDKKAAFSESKRIYNTIVQPP